VYKALDKEKLLDPDVLTHKLFNKYDCGRVLQAALTTTMTALQKKVRLEDRQHSGKRQHPEAGAEIAGMTGEVSETHLDPARVATQATQALNSSLAHKSLGKAKTKALKKAVHAKGFHPGTNKFKDFEKKVEACALILASGDTLSAPTIKAKLKSFSGSSWRSERDRGDGNTGGKKRGLEGGGSVCPAQGCDAALKINPSTERPFTMCYNHFQMLREGKSLKDKDGKSMSLPPPRERDSPNGDLRGKLGKRQKVVDGQVGEVEGKSAAGDEWEITLQNSDGQQVTRKVDAHTMSVINEARMSGLMMVDKAVSKQEQLANVFGRQ
jgi:hypothetical protein